MKRLILIGIVAIAAIVIVAPAQARGYTCTYKASGMYVTIDGYDNNSYFCRMFASGFTSGTRTSSVRGTAWCAWASRNMDVRITVRAKSATFGRLACTYLSGSVSKSQFRRLY